MRISDWSSDVCSSDLHMLDLAGADAEGERAHAAMAGGVAVAADDGRTGQREALFRTHHVDNALLARIGIDIANAEFGRIAFKRGELRCAFRVGDRQAPTDRKSTRLNSSH